MKKNIFWIFLLIPLIAWAAATTIESAGNWSDSSNWASSNIADSITEDVDMDNNTGTITIQNGESYTISVFDMKNGNTLTIDEGGALNVGNASNADDLKTGNTATINVNGNLIIWGNLDVGNTLNFNVGTNGSVTIKGNVELGNNGTLVIEGDVEVEGDFNAGTGTDLTINGTLDIDGDYTVGNGSTSSGSGSSSYGSCTGPPGFCGGAPLPVELISFKGVHETEKVVLTWVTASEINNDYFLIEKSLDGKYFTEIGQVEGNGTTAISQSYQFSDSQLTNGNIYYRLKQVDLDGSFEFSQVISVRVIITNYSFLDVYPNPVNQGRIINIDYGASGNKTLLQLYDFTGKLVWEQMVEKEEDSFQNSFQLETGKLPKGMLILRMISNNQALTKRVKLN
jgi:archaellum component FlaG (FlaF/FlaG flagellin family)